MIPMEPRSLPSAAKTLGGVSVNHLGFLIFVNVL